MPRHPARITQAEITRALRAAGHERVVEVILADGTVIRLSPRGADLPDDGKARNALGYVEARLADAPWAKSK
jgi:hypothetical protein